MFYLGLSVCVCFKQRLNVFFTYFKKRYKVTKLMVKNHNLLSSKVTQIRFFSKTASKCYTKKPQKPTASKIVFP